MRQIKKWILLIAIGIPSVIKANVYAPLAHIEVPISDEVTCVAFDYKGMMWIGTTTGLLNYDGHTFRHYRSALKTPHLLPNNYIQCLTADRSDRLWIGTNNGIACMELRTGHIKHYHLPKQNQQIIYTLFTSDDGTIYAGTDGGLLKYDPAKDLFVSQNLVPGEKAGDNLLDNTGNYYSVKAISEDRHGNLYIGTWSNGLIRIDNKRKTINKIVGTVQNVYALCFDTAGRLWTGGWEHGAFVIAQPDSTFLPHIIPVKGTENQRVYKIVHDPASQTVWFCMQSGILIRHNQNNETTWIPNKARGFQSIASNGHGLIVAATAYDGIYTYTTMPSPLEFIPVDSGLSQTTPYTVSSLYTTNGTVFWLASKQKELAAFHIPGKKGSLISHMTTFDRLPRTFRQSPYSAIARRTNGELWLGNMYYGILVISPNGEKRIVNSSHYKFLKEEGVTSLYSDKNGNMWIGQWSHIAVIRPDNSGYTIDLQHHIPGFYKNKVNHITQDHSGRMWISTHNKGIIRIEENNEHRNEIRLTVYNPQNGKLPFEGATACLEDKQHRIWAISSESGLLQWDKENDCFKAAPEEYGIDEEKIYAINMDDYGNLWLAADNYIIKITDNGTTPTVAMRFYTQGYPEHVKLQENASFKQGKYLYFGGVNGFLRFNPDQIATTREGASQKLITVTDLLVDGIPFRDMDSLDRQKTSPFFPGYKKKITLFPSAEKLGVEFAMLEYDGRKPRKYAYWLEGYHTTWKNCETGNHRASFENLPSGTYTLYLKVTDSNGKWCEIPYGINIEVLPHWWETWWAILSYLLAASALLYGMALWYRQRLRTRSKLQMNHVFTHLTHELLTPLAVISASVENMQGKLPKTDYSIVRRNIQRLTRLIRQILEVRKSQEGRLQLQVSEGDLTEFTRNIFEAISPLAQSKNIRMQFLEKGQATPNTYFDPDKIDKIVYNLLANAIKYTWENGQIRLTCDYTHKGHATLAVEDTGIGIDRQRLKNLYRQFMDGNYRSMNTTGTGIGLSLTHDLVKLHHGTIACQSTLGKGTTFTVQIPTQIGAYTPYEIGQTAEKKYKQAEKEHIALNSQTEKEENSKNAPETASDYKILIVEDHTELLQLMARVLGKRYEVYTATNGEQALNIIRKKPLDIVISDVMMPVIDGVELTRKIKTEPDYAQLPVILLTAKTGDANRDEAYKAGADEYLIKPFGLEALQLRVENIIGNRERIRRKFMSQTDFSPEAQHYSDPDTLFMEKAVECVRQHLDDPAYDRERFAADMCMSSSTLYKKLRALTGQNVSSFVNSIRLKEACRLTKENPYIQISELSARLGYNTPAYFTRVFKKEFGMTLTEYKATLTHGEDGTSFT